MVLPNPNNATTPKHISVPDLLHSFKTGGTLNFLDEIDSNCSTPYVSAPSSPGCNGGTCGGYFFSAPTSPMHCMHSSVSSQASCSGSGSFEFEFSSRFTTDSSVGTGSMSSADELFCNGKIRPMKLSSHLQRPQMLAPLLDLEVEEDDEKVEESATRGRDLKLRSRSIRMKAVSMSPLRNSQFRGPDDDVIENADITEHVLEVHDVAEKLNYMQSTMTTPSVSASSSRSSSSSGRNSKKWIFLKEFLYKSKSEGSVTGKEKFWSSISFSPAKEKNTTTPLMQKPKQSTQSSSSSKSISGKPINPVEKRRTTVIPSPHELHYTANRAQAEELKKKTYLPYRQGLFECLGFSSKGCGALNGFTRSFNPVS